ncbi:MAG: hypothetical protein Q7U37_03735 [Gallionella sp.]|nr:hypothetical protein [Gallionella sp.]
MKFFNELLAILAAVALFFFKSKLKKIFPFMKDAEAKYGRQILFTHGFGLPVSTRLCIVLVLNQVPKGVLK